jgi:hypothetical protein
MERSAVVEGVDAEALRRIAEQCVTLVSEQFGRRLDWSMGSLTELDRTCGDLLADGPLAGERLDLWSRLAGAYTGEVVIKLYDGQWIIDEQGQRAPAVLVLGITGRPFYTARRILSGEPYKSLASFARAVPVISEHSRRTGDAGDAK